MIRKLLFTIFLVFAFASSGWGAHTTENFSADYTEVDPVTYLDRTATRTTWTNLSHSVDAYVYKDFTANHFAGDFYHTFDVQWNSMTATGIVAGWMLANAVDDVKAISDSATEDALYIRLNEAAGSVYIRLCEADGSTIYFSQSTALTVDTTYYIRVWRDDDEGTYGKVYMDVYTSAANRSNWTSPKDEESIELHTSKKDFRYLYSASSWNSGGGATVNTGFHENLRLHETPQTFYSDFTAGNDSNAGTSGSPWKYAPGMPPWTGTATMIDGDTIYFDRNDTWTGTTSYWMYQPPPGVTSIGDVWDPESGGANKAEFKVACDNYSWQYGPNSGRAVINIRYDNVSVQGFELDGDNYRAQGMLVGNWGEEAVDNFEITRMEIHDMGHVGTTEMNLVGGIVIGARNEKATTNGAITWNKIENVANGGITFYPVHPVGEINPVDTVLIRGNEIINSAESDESIQATIFLNNDNRNITIEFNKLHGNQSSGVWFTANDAHPQNSAIGTVVRWNHIYDNMGNGINFNGYCNKEVEIYGNIIENNDKSGIVFASDLYDEVDVEIYNNTFDRNGMNASAAFQQEIHVQNSNVTYTNFKFSNNIFYARSGGYRIFRAETAEGAFLTAHLNNHWYDLDGTSDTIVGYNGLSYTSVNITSFEATATTGDPLFTNEAGDDFTLTSTSPCIDAGTTTIGNLLDPTSTWPDGVLTGPNDEVGAYYRGVTYYMRADGTASDKQSADGPCGTVGDCMSIATHDGETFGPDDVLILCDDGGIYRDQLDPPSSGGVGGQITYRGEQGDPKPKMYGSDQISDWTLDSGSVWKATLSGTVETDPVWFIETNSSISWGDRKTDKVSLAEEYDFFHDTGANILYVYTTPTGDPDTRYSSVEAAQRDYIIRDTSGLDYLTIEDLEIVFSRTATPGTASTACGGIELIGQSDNIIIQDNEVHHISSRDSASGEGIQLEGDDGLIRRNKIYQVGRRPIGISTTTKSVDALVMEYNELYDSYYGMSFDVRNLSATGTITNLVIRYNTVYISAGRPWSEDPDGGNGCVFDGYAGQPIDGLDIYSNTFYDINGFGIFIRDNVDNVTIYNNTLANCGNNGIYIDNGTLTTTIKNNLVHNGSIALDINDSTNKTVDYNAWWRQGGGYIVDIDATAYTAWNTYNDTTGFDTNGIHSGNDFVDPGLVGWNTQDLTLTSSSPCIDKGIIPSGFESIFPLDPDDLVWPPTVAAEDYNGVREIGAFAFKSTSVGEIGKGKSGVGVGVEL